MSPKHFVWRIQNSWPLRYLCFSLVWAYEKMPPYEERSPGTQKARRRKILTACFILSLPGTLLHFGNLLPYLVSYYHSYRPRLHMDPLWVSSGFQICRFLGILSSAPVESHIGLLATLALGGVIVCVSILTSYWSVVEPVAFLLTFGVCYGFGSGLMFPMIAKAGLQQALGRSRWNYAIIAAGSPVGGFLYMIVAFLVINPLNSEPDLLHQHVQLFTQHSVVSNVPNYFLVMLCVTAVIVGLGMALIHSDSRRENTAGSEDYAGEFSDMEEMILYAAQPDQANGLKEKTKAGQYGTLKHHTKPQAAQATNQQEGDSSKSSQKSLLTGKSRDYWLDYTNPSQAESSDSASPTAPEKTPGHDSGSQGGDVEAQPTGSYSRIGEEQHVTTTMISESSEVSGTEGRREMTPAEVLSTGHFWILWVCALLFGHTQFVHENLYKQYGQTEIANDAILLLPGLLGMLAIAGIRPFSFQASNRWGTGVSVLAVCALANVFMTLMNVTLNLLPALYIVFAMLEFAAVSNVDLLHHLAPTGLPQAWSGAQNLVCTAPLVGSLLEPVIVHVILQHGGGWNWLATSASLTSAVALCGLLLLPVMQLSR